RSTPQPASMGTTARLSARPQQRRRAFITGTRSAAEFLHRLHEVRRERTARHRHERPDHPEQPQRARPGITTFPRARSTRRSRLATDQEDSSPGADRQPEAFAEPRHSPVREVGTTVAIVARVLVTGMSGTGKSTVLGELERRGHVVVDTDYGGWTLPDGT